MDEKQQLILDYNFCNFETFTTMMQFVRLYGFRFLGNIICCNIYRGDVNEN
jgi:hypothetical protein